MGWDEREREKKEKKKRRSNNNRFVKRFSDALHPGKWNIFLNKQLAEKTSRDSILILDGKGYKFNKTTGKREFTLKSCQKIAKSIFLNIYFEKIKNIIKKIWKIENWNKWRGFFVCVWFHRVILIMMMMFFFPVWGLKSEKEMKNHWVRVNLTFLTHHL